MKTSRLLLTLTVALTSGALLLASCTKEATEQPGTTPVKRQLQVSIDGVTRASLDNIDIKWDDQDKIKVFYQTATGITESSDFALVDGAGSTNATFEEIESNMAEGDKILYALYPAEEYWDYAAAEEYEIPCNLPAVQSFDKFAMPMYGTPDTQADRILFRNCAAVFTLRLQGSGTITKVRLTATSRYLAGKGAIDISTPDEPKFRVEYYKNGFGFYDQASVVKESTFDCGNLTLSETPTEIPIVIPILPGSTSFGVSSLAFEFYNGDNLLMLKKNTSTKTSVRNKKSLFPIWEFNGAASGEDLSAQIAAAVAAGKSQLILTAPLSGDQTITLPNSISDKFQIFAPFTDGTITVKAEEGAVAASTKTVQFANMATNSTAQFDFQLNGSGIDISFYGKAETLRSDVARLTLMNKDTSTGRPIAEVKNLIIDGGSVLSSYAEEPETLQINEGNIFWKRTPQTLTPPEGLYSYWTPDPYTTSTSLVLQWTTTPILQGAGTEADPYLITSTADINRIGWQFTKATEDLFEGSYFRLAQDIDAQNEVLSRWGSCTNAQANGSAFAGHFDGNGKTISNFTINSGYYGIGFFGFTRNASIENLHLQNVSILLSATVSNGARWIGGLIGLMQGGSVSGCTVTNLTVDKAKSYNNYYRVGGLVGFASGAECNFTKCSVDQATLRGWYAMGGFIGSVQTQKTVISDCTTDQVTIEHAYGLASDPTYCSGPLVGDMGVSGTYNIEINNLSLGSWTIACTHTATSAAGWAAQKATAWPYVGEIIPEATITVDGVSVATRTLTEADMIGSGE